MLSEFWNWIGDCIVLGAWSNGILSTPFCQPVFWFYKSSITKKPTCKLLMIIKYFTTLYNLNLQIYYD